VCSAIPLGFHLLTQKKFRVLCSFSWFNKGILLLFESTIPFGDFEAPPKMILKIVGCLGHSLSVVKKSNANASESKLLALTIELCHWITKHFVLSFQFTFS